MNPLILTSLPNDILIRVLSQLQPRDIINIRKVCANFEPTPSLGRYNMAERSNDPRVLPYPLDYRHAQRYLPYLDRKPSGLMLFTGCVNKKPSSVRVS